MMRRRTDSTIHAIPRKVRSVYPRNQAAVSRDMDAAGDALSESLGAVAPELLAQLAAEKRGGR